MKTPAVLLVALSKKFGGADVRVLQLAEALEGRISYRVATLRDSPLHRKLTAARLKAISLPYARWDARWVIALGNIIRCEGITLVDAHNPQSHFWGLLAARSVGLKAVVTTVHNATEATISRWKRSCSNRILLINAMTGSRFIAVSPSIADSLAALGVKRQAIATIPNAIVIPAAVTVHRPSVRRSFGWDDGHFLVTTVARLETVKGLSILVEAIQSIASIQPALRCLIVGEGSQHARLKAQIKAAGLERIVHLAGFRTDIPDLLAASDAFCLPSYSEGLPFALLEACACRVPTLVTRVGGMAEFFEHMQTSIMVPAGDAKALAAGMVHLMASPERNRAMAEAAFALIQTAFSPQQMITRTMEVYGCFSSESVGREQHAR